MRIPISMRTALTAAAILTAPAAHAADSLTLVTSEAPPLSVISADNSRVSGTTTDLLAKTMAEAGIGYTILPYPWLRALDMARTQKNTCVYPTARSPEREALYKWVGPTGTSVWTLFGRRGEKAPLSLDQVGDRGIGGTQGDAGTQYLKDRGFKIDESQYDSFNLRKLRSKHVDYWLTTLATGRFRIDQAGAEDIVPMLSVKEVPLYLACNPSVPDKVVAKLTALLKHHAGQR